MVEYLALILIPFFYYLFALANKVEAKKINSKTIIIFFVSLFLLLSLRNITVGVDLASYSQMFVKFSKIGIKDINSFSTEPGYVALNFVVSKLTNNFQWFVVVVSAITVFPILFVYKEDTVDPLLTISLFVFMPTFIMMFSGLRQCIAISLGMFAYYFTKEKKLFFFLVTVMIAFMFHKSALMLFLMYPIFHFKMKKIYMYFIVPLSVVVFVYNRQIFDYASRFLDQYYDTSVMQTGAYKTLILFILFGIFSYVVIDDNKIDGNFIGLRNLLLLSILLQMFAPLHSLAMRLNYYYIIFIPITIPKVISLTSVKWRQVSHLARYIITFFFALYFLMYGIKDNSLQIYPYNFFWQ